MDSDVEHLSLNRLDPSKKGIFHVDDDFVDMVAISSEADLLDLAALYQEPLSNDEIEMFLFVCDTLALKNWSDEYMHQAKEMAERSLKETKPEHPDYCHRQQLVDSIVSRVDAYSYQPVSDGKRSFERLFGAEPQIRLIHLHAGRGLERLQCSLEIVEPFSSPASEVASYEAISYVWGNSKKKEYVYCDGKRLPITFSLATALRRLRLADKVRVLWADGVCINQEDLNERSEQVALMAAIYSRAHQVLCWLGEDEGNNAKKAFDLGTRLWAKLKPSFEGTDRLVLTGKLSTGTTAHIDVAAYLLSRFADEPLEAELMSNKGHVEVLFENPWFERMWIRQEISYASKARIIWGDSELEWDTLQWLCRWSIFKNTSLRINSMDSFNPDISFLKLLLESRDFKCTDPRDRVFALLGHPSAYNEADVPDAKDYCADLIKALSTKPRDEELIDNKYYEAVNKLYIDGTSTIIRSMFPELAPAMDSLMSDSSSITDESFHESGAAIKNALAGLSGFDSSLMESGRGLLKIMTGEHGTDITSIPDLEPVLKVLAYNKAPINHPAWPEAVGKFLDKTAKDFQVRDIMGVIPKYLRKRFKAKGWKPESSEMTSVTDSSVPKSSREADGSENQSDDATLDAGSSHTHETENTPDSTTETAPDPQIALLDLTTKSQRLDGDNIDWDAEVRSDLKLGDDTLKLSILSNQFRRLSELRNPREHPVYRARKHLELGCIYSYPIAKANYDPSNTLEDVYLRVATQILINSKSLDILCAVQHNPKEDLSDTHPSWVPRWDLEQIHHYLGIDSGFKSWPLDLAQPDIGKLNGMVLTCPGVIIDTITSSTIPVGADVFFDPPRLMSFWKSITDFDLSARLTTRVEKVRAYQRTLTANNTAGASASLVVKDFSDDTLWDNFALFWSFLHYEDATATGDKINTKIFPVPELWENAQRGKDQEFLKIACVISRGRKVFCTEKGFLGIGPQVLKKGDVVCILPCSVPFVLRPVENQNYYLLAGECYVDGIMNGEEMDASKIEIRSIELH